MWEVWEVLVQHSKKKITLLYISWEKFTVISAMPLRQHFETGDLKLFSNLDLNWIRILKTTEDQTPSNEIYLGQGSSSICITKDRMWVSEVKKNFKKFKMSSSPFFHSLHDFTVHKEQVKQTQNNLIILFHFFHIFHHHYFIPEPNWEALLRSTHNIAWSTLEIQMLSRSYHTVLPYRHFHNLRFTKTFASSGWGITHLRPHF